MILVPFFTFIFVVVWIATYIYALAYLASCGEMTPKSITIAGNTLGSYMVFEWTETEFYFMWFSLFMFLWVLFFILAANNFVHDVGVVSWYFTCREDKVGDFSICRGMWWLIRYNCGSVLFGSFLIALITFLRILAEYLEAQVKAANGGAPPVCVSCLFGCIRCCLDCCDRFVKYINENAYCQIAITGESFCSAAINGFCLLLKNAGAFGFTGSVGGIFNLLGKLAVTSGTCIGMYILMLYTPSIYDRGGLPIAPLVVVFIISYTISSVFMSLSSSTANCLLHCLYADVDICH